MFDVITESLSYLANPLYWVTLLAAMAIATALGLLPGVGSVVTMGILLPIVIIGIEEPAIGIVFLAAITGLGNTFDSIPAQLMGIVGSGTQVTFLEGHQLTRQGKGAHALGATYAVSAIGGLTGAAFLLMVLPIMKPIILAFSFGEIAVLAFFGLCMVAILSRGAMLKGLAAAFFGLVLGTVGMQDYTGVERFTFGIYDLQTGLPLIATILGVMAMPEMIDLVATRQPVAAGGDVSRQEVFRGFREGLRRWRMAMRHSIFGAAMGVIPGTSGSVVTWLSYGLGIALSKDRSEFGKGSLDGLLFAESAENAKEGGQALPTLVLGVPASPSWALVLVAMIAYGVSPGPNMIDEHGGVIGLIVITFAIANLFLTVLALFLTGQLMKLTRVPYIAIGAAVIPIVFVGAYLGDSIAEVSAILFAFTGVGLLMKWLGWPRPPLVLALILGPIIEDNLWSAVAVQGGWLAVLLRPVTIGLLIVLIVTIAFLQIAMGRADKVAASAGVVNPDSEDAPALVSDGSSVNAELAAAAESAPSASASTIAVHQLERRHRFGWAFGRSALPNYFTAALFLVGVSTWITAREFRYEQASVFPVIASVGLIAFAGLQLISQIRHPGREQGQIMDLGMRSTEVAGAFRTGVVAWVMVLAYVLIIPVIGMPYASITFAFVMPILLMKGRSRWRTAVISAVLVWLFVFGVDSAMNVIWPISLFEGF